MAESNFTAAPTPLLFEGYTIAEGLVHLNDAGAAMNMRIGELVNRDDLIARLSPEDALRIGSWHGAYVARKACVKAPETKMRSFVLRHADGLQYQHVRFDDGDADRGGRHG